MNNWGNFPCKFNIKCEFCINKIIFNNTGSLYDISFHMKDILVVNGHGNIIDRSKLFVNISGGSVISFNIGQGAATASFATGSVFTLQSAPSSGNVVVYNGSSINWQNQYATAVSSSTSVGPKYISVVGGVFFKDQKDELVKYQNVIFGSFNNKNIRE
jgi:hypothetical protein